MTGYHGNLPTPGGYGDYFRYTRDGLNTLFGKFQHIKIIPAGGKLYQLIGLIPIVFLRRALLSKYLIWLVNLADKRVPTQSPYRWFVIIQKSP